ncbi:hypothetical protein ABK040_010789 [Willaertia magna]
MEVTAEGKASNTLYLSRSFLVRDTNNSRWNEITNNYYLQNIHFHSPSEHALYGRFYDLEMHMVFLNPNTPNDTPKTVVIGKLYQAVDNDFYTSPLIETVIKNYNALVKENGEESEKTIVQLDGSTLHGLIEFTPSYYVYNGSLTTPNCIENVMWHVINDIEYINIPQLTSIKKLLNQIHYVNFTQGNYRPEQYLPDARLVQPRNNRPILFRNRLIMPSDNQSSSDNEEVSEIMNNPSSLLQRLKDFLPQIKKANDELLENPQGESCVEIVEGEEKKRKQRKIREENEEEEEQYVQMNVALGVFEEKQKQKGLIQEVDEEGNQINLEENEEDKEDLPKLRTNIGPTPLEKRAQEEEIGAYFNLVSSLMGGNDDSSSSSESEEED